MVKKLVGKMSTGISEKALNMKNGDAMRNWKRRSRIQRKL